MALRFADVATNKPLAPATNKPELATNSDPPATNAAPRLRTANRRDPQAFRDYQRDYMRKRRAAAKASQ